MRKENRGPHFVEIRVSGEHTPLGIFEMLERMHQVPLTESELDAAKRALFHKQAGPVIGRDDLHIKIGKISYKRSPPPKPSRIEKLSGALRSFLGAVFRDS